MAFGASGIAMGTRFLMTAESPVPAATKERYIACGNPADIIISRAIDGMPQRMVMNEMLGQLERAGALRKLLLAIQSGLAYSKYTGASLFSLLQSGLRMRAEDGLTLAQAIMSANAPMVIQRAMVEGHPEEGVLPGGQVAGVINDLPTCAELVARIALEAEECLRELAARGRT